MAEFCVNDSLFSSAFFIEPGTFSTKIEIDSLHNSVVITESKANKEYFEYRNIIKNVEEKISNWYSSVNKLLDIHSQKLPALIQDSLQNENKKNNIELDSELFNYTQSHLNSFVALWVFNHQLKLSGYKPIYETIFEGFDDSIKNTPLGIQTKEMLIISKKVSINYKFPKFEAINSIGKNIFLTDSLIAKFTLIDFWAVYCIPCIRQFDDFKKIYENYFNIGFDLKGVSVDSKEHEIDKNMIIKKFKLKWPQYWDIDGKVANKYLIDVFPANFLLDHNGLTIKKNIGAFELERFLYEHLKN